MCDIGDAIGISHELIERLQDLCEIEEFDKNLNLRKNVANYLLICHKFCIKFEKDIKLRIIQIQQILIPLLEVLFMDINLLSKYSDWKDLRIRPTDSKKYDPMDPHLIFSTTTSEAIRFNNFYEARVFFHLLKAKIESNI